MSLPLPSSDSLVVENLRDVGRSLDNLFVKRVFVSWNHLIGALKISLVNCLRWSACLEIVSFYLVCKFVSVMCVKGFSGMGNYAAPNLLKFRIIFSLLLHGITPPLFNLTQKVKAFY